MNNFSFDDIVKLAKAAEDKRPEDMLTAAESKIPQDKMNEIKKVLSDKKALENLLKSEQAQKLMQQLKNNK